MTEFAKLDSTRVLARLERYRTSQKSAEPSGVLPPRHPVSQGNTSTTYGNRPQLSRRFPVSRFCFVFFPLEPFLPFPSCFACVFFLSPTAREKSVRLYWSTLSLAARTVTARRFPCGAPAFLNTTFSTVKNAACIWPGSVLGFRLSLHYVRDTLIP